MFGIGWYFPVFLLWAFLGPIAWGVLSALNWKHSRPFAWLAAISSALSVIVPLIAAYESRVNAGAAAMAFAVISLPVFIMSVIIGFVLRLRRRRTMQTFDKH